MSTRARVLVLTWISYASYYLCRKNVSVSKTALQESLGLTTAQLGSIDTGYLAAYAIGQFTMGVVGDWLGPRRLIGLGMLSAALLTGCCAGAGSFALLAALFGMNGLMQATGWPGNIKAIAPWFTAAERGRVMGLWSTCYQLGGLAAGALTAWLLARYGWRTAFWGPATIVGSVGLLLLATLPERDLEPAANRRSVQLGLVRDPALWSLGLGYFCLKLIRYSLLFWLPFYLERSLGYARGHAGMQSLAFEAGGTVGAVAVGFVSDRLLRGRRGMAGIGGCLCLAGALAIYVVVGRFGAWPNFLALALVGAALFGPDSIISGAAAQDLGGAAASGTAAGFINGMGSVGAVLQGWLTAWVSQRYGWDALFQVFVGLALVASVALVPVWRAERRRAAVQISPA